MRRSKRSEKLFIEKAANSAKDVLKLQRGLKIGQLIAIIRTQLGMSQRSLAKRAKTPQPNISKIELGRLQPNISTIKRILNAMECDLLISAIPRKSIESIRRDQAKIKAQTKIQYLHGTMSLEKQAPDQELLNELINDEIKKMLDSESTKLWEE